MIRKTVFCMLSVTLMCLNSYATHPNQQKNGSGRKKYLLVTINHNRSIVKMVQAGKYNYTNPDITSENFPSGAKGEAKVFIRLVHIDRDMAFDEVLRELDRRGLRPAKLVELLALGEQHPELQRQFPIVALGSFCRCWDGGRCVPYLSGVGAGRSLRLYRLEGTWNSDCRFAAVRK